jgi:hypothetical protein
VTTTMIETYFRIDSDFVPMTQFTGELPDNNYIEGAIVWRVGGRDIFKLQHWDLIDQLWVYIVDGLNRLEKGEDYDVFFPDQPLRLRFEIVSPHCVEAQ